VVIKQKYQFQALHISKNYKIWRMPQWHISISSYHFFVYAEIDNDTKIRENAASAA
jgi:hypothetical protein